MEILAEKRINIHDRSEEVEDIIERMPQKFGLVISGIVLTIFLLIFILSYIIKYPDKVSGTVTINTEASPIKLVANASGKLININPGKVVHEGDYIGVIQNPANLQSVKSTFTILRAYADINVNNYKSALDKLPKNAALGEISMKYYAFINSLIEINNFYNDDILQKQIEQLTSSVNFSEKEMAQLVAEKEIRQKNYTLQHKAYARDSILFSHKNQSEEEFEKGNIEFLQSKEGYVDILKDIESTQGNIRDAQYKLIQLNLQRKEKVNQLLINTKSSYSDLFDDFKQWEIKYVIKAPISGVVEFTNFYKENDYLQAGQDILKIIPTKNAIIGQMYLPAEGSGKVKVGQNVIVKLENFPYEEYGSINGTVKSISIVPNDYKVSDKTTNQYLVAIELPKGLQTNYGSNLEFKYEAKGTADIVTKDERLLFRLFDNLKYIINQ